MWVAVIIKDDRVGFHVILHKGIDNTFKVIYGKENREDRVTWQ